MSIQNLLEGKVYYNQKLSEEFDKDLVSYDAQGKLIPPSGSNLVYFLKKNHFLKLKKKNPKLIHYY